MLPTELPKPDQITIAQVIDLYLSMGTKDLAAESLRLIRATLREFRAEFGERRVVDCRAVELLAYMQANEVLAQRLDPPLASVSDQALTELGG